jgi:diaminopimelate epimerase
MQFFKYHGTGNDFIMVDNREDSWQPTSEEVAGLCDRHFGIGADGLILIEGDEETEFYMNYYNSDGSQSFCGNGSRCAVAFAKSLGMLEKEEASFRAIDGYHEAKINGEEISIRMTDVKEVVVRSDNEYFVNTGSPHVVSMVEDLNIDVMELGSGIRYSEEFEKEGTNVNFLTLLNPNEAMVRTYERGVEGETLSCGTGVTACAIVMHHLSNNAEEKQIHALGGDLTIRFEKTEKGYENIWLCGPAELVFKGEWMS